MNTTKIRQALAERWGGLLPQKSVVLSLLLLAATPSLGKVVNLRDDYWSEKSNENLRMVAAMGNAAMLLKKEQTIENLSDEVKQHLYVLLNSKSAEGRQKLHALNKDDALGYVINILKNALEVQSTPPTPPTPPADPAAAKAARIAQLQAAVDAAQEDLSEAEVDGTEEQKAAALKTLNDAKAALADAQAGKDSVGMSEAERQAKILELTNKNKQKKEDQSKPGSGDAAAKAARIADLQAAVDAAQEDLAEAEVDGTEEQKAAALKTLNDAKAALAAAQA